MVNPYLGSIVNPSTLNVCIDIYYIESLYAIVILPGSKTFDHSPALLAPDQHLARYLVITVAHLGRRAHNSISQGKRLIGQRRARPVS